MYKISKMLNSEVVKFYAILYKLKYCNN